MRGMEIGKKTLESFYQNGLSLVIEVRKCTLECWSNHRILMSRKTTQIEYLMGSIYDRVKRMQLSFDSL